MLLSKDKKGLKSYKNMENKYKAPGNEQDKEKKVESDGYITSEKGDIQTEEEWKEELNKRNEDSNWFREQQ